MKQMYSYLTKKNRSESTKQYEYGQVGVKTSGVHQFYQQFVVMNVVCSREKNQGIVF